MSGKKKGKGPKKTTPNRNDPYMTRSRVAGAAAAAAAATSAAADTNDENNSPFNFGSLSMNADPYATPPSTSAHASPAAITFTDLMHNSAKLEAQFRSEMHDEIATLRDSFETMKNDLLSAIQQSSKPTPQLGSFPVPPPGPPVFLYGQPSMLPVSCQSFATSTMQSAPVLAGSSGAADSKAQVQATATVSTLGVDAATSAQGTASPNKIILMADPFSLVHPYAGVATHGNF